jgi:hypothetical protein
MAMSSGAIAFIPFHPKHMAAIELQEAQACFAVLMSKPSYTQAICEPGLSFTGVVADRVVGCAGVLPQWPGRAIAWAVLSARIPARAWPAITRHVIRVLDAAHARGHDRIECTVDCGHFTGMEWVRRVGFDKPQRLERYSPIGPHGGPNGGARDHFLYRRFADQASGAMAEARRVRRAMALRIAAEIKREKAA